MIPVGLVSLYLSFLKSKCFLNLWLHITYQLWNSLSHSLIKYCLCLFSSPLIWDTKFTCLDLFTVPYICLVLLYGTYWLSASLLGNLSGLFVNKSSLSISLDISFWTVHISQSGVFQSSIWMESIWPLVFWKVPKEEWKCEHVAFI